MFWTFFVPVSSECKTAFLLKMEKDFLNKNSQYIFPDSRGVDLSHKYDNFRLKLTKSKKTCNLILILTLLACDFIWTSAF